MSHGILNKYELYVKDSSGKAGQYARSNGYFQSRDENYINKLNGNPRNVKHSNRDWECLCQDHQYNW